MRYDGPVMSRFFSTKYLKYRALTPTPGRGKTIEEDLYCKSCGYNLRGLPAGRRCPECGADPLAEEPGTYVTEGGVARRPLVDLATVGSDSQHARWRLGLTIAATCVAVATGARMTLLFGGILGPSTVQHLLYVGAGLAVSLAWTICMPMVLPAPMGAQWPWTRPLRAYVLATQWLWIAGYALWAYSIVRWGVGGAPVGHVLTQLGLRFVAGTGVIVLCVLLRFIAAEAEREKAERRFNATVWFLPVATLAAAGVAAVFPSSVSSMQRTPWGLVHLLFTMPPLLFLTLWCWVMALLLLAIAELRRHAIWTERYARETEDREIRIAEKKQRMEETLEEKIRPLPKREGEVALAEPKKKRAQRNK